MHHSAVRVSVADLAFEVSGVRAGRVRGLDATRPDLALNACGCGCCHDEASDPVALNAGFVASDPGAVEVPVVAAAQGRGGSRAGAGGRRDAAAARAGVVRGDAGGLGTPAAQPPAERAAGGEPGAAGPPVPGVHDGVAVGVDAGAGGAVELLGRVGAFDDPVLSGRAGGVPGLCVRCPVRVAGGVRAAGGCPSGAGLP